VRHQARHERVRRLALVGATVSALVVAGVVVWPRSPAPVRVAGAGSAVRAGPVAARSSPRPPTSSTSPTSVPTVRSPAGSTPRSARAILTVLDHAREAAYAHRDPARLSAVYSSALLLARDRDQLLSAVPPGCGLTGVRTTFEHVRAVRRGSRLQVHARVRVRAASLECRGSPGVRAPPARPVSMTIDLHRTRSGYRIESERRD
jgi:hypothetical protein